MQGQSAKSLVRKIGTLILAGVFLSSAYASLIESEETAMPIRLQKTRIVLKGDERVAFLNVYNESDRPVMMSATVLSETEDGAGDIAGNLLVSPPTRVISPQNMQALRVVLSDKRDLSADRESLFYLRLKFIPADRRGLREHSILSGMLTLYAKVFYRPASLSSELIQSVEVCKKVEAEKVSDGIRLSNPTPYWVTFPYLTLDGKDLPREMRAPMIRPKGELLILNEGDELRFRCVTENGVYTAEETRTLK